MLQNMMVRSCKRLLLASATAAAALSTNHHRGCCCDAFVASTVSLSAAVGPTSATRRLSRRFFQTKVPLVHRPSAYSSSRRSTRRGSRARRPLSPLTSTADGFSGGLTSMTSGDVESSEDLEVENIVVIGSGPAGYTASIYAGRANLRPLCFEGLTVGPPGGQLMTTTDVRKGWVRYRQTESPLVNRGDAFGACALHFLTCKIGFILAHVSYQTTASIIGLRIRSSRLCCCS